MNGDFSQKLNQVLSNPAMMAQIKALADTMTEADTQKEKAEPVRESAVLPKESESPAKQESAEDADTVRQAVPVPAFFTPSPSFEKNMKNTCTLLNALKPFLDERRCAKIDKMLSMIRFAQMAGQLGNFF
jgi:hypothetical protein